MGNKKIFNQKRNEAYRKFWKLYPNGDECDVARYISDIRMKGYYKNDKVFNYEKLIKKLITEIRERRTQQASMFASTILESEVMLEQIMEVIDEMNTICSAICITEKLSAKDMFIDFNRRFNKIINE